MKCVNCNKELHGRICHNCGQKVFSQRWTVTILLNQFIQQITNIETGFWYTCRTLFSEPERLITSYWRGVTVTAYNPFRYMLIWTAINFIISFSLGIDDLLQEHLQPSILGDNVDNAKIDAADQKFDAWLNALVLLMIPVFALLTRWLFKRHQKNYAEHLILNSFMLGQQSLITSFTHFLFYFFPTLFLFFLPFNFLVGLVYNSYIFKKVFHDSLVMSVLKALGFGLIGMIVFFGFIKIASELALFIS